MWSVASLWLGLLASGRWCRWLIFSGLSGCGLGHDDDEIDLAPGGLVCFVCSVRLSFVDGSWSWCCRGEMVKMRAIEVR